MPAMDGDVAVVVPPFVMPLTGDGEFNSGFDGLLLLVLEGLVEVFTVGIAVAATAVAADVGAESAYCCEFDG
jgi:hypothetical protein